MLSRHCFSSFIALVRSLLSLHLKLLLKLLDLSLDLLFSLLLLSHLLKLQLGSPYIVKGLTTSLGLLEVTRALLLMSLCCFEFFGQVVVGGGSFLDVVEDVIKLKSGFCRKLTTNGISSTFITGREISIHLVDQELAVLLSGLLVSLVALLCNLKLANIDLGIRKLFLYSCDLGVGIAQKRLLVFFSQASQCFIASHVFGEFLVVSLIDWNRLLSFRHGVGDGGVWRERKGSLRKRVKEDVGL